MKELYLRIEGENVNGAPPSLFNLHDSIEDFCRNPRVFTTFSIFQDSAAPEAAADGNKKGENRSWLNSFPFGTLHLKRLRTHAAELDICFSRETERLITEAIERILADSKQQESSPRGLINPIRIRIAVGREVTELHISAEQNILNPSKPHALKTVEVSRHLPNLKTTCTSSSRFAQASAEAAGANEALLVGTDGIVREGAWSNIFWLDALGVLFTPAENLLPGCIREMILRYGPVKQGNFSTAELLSTAAEVFITKSTVGIIPVCSIDEVNIGGQNTDPQNASLENKQSAVCRLQQWLQEISLQ